MNETAMEMNKILKEKSDIFYFMLSDFGKNIYMPKGIIVQSAEAKQKAQKYNATIGIAESKKEPIFLKSLNKYFNILKPDQIFPYAPAPGVQELRKKWKNKILQENNLIKSQDMISMPVVTNGLTHGIMLFADLFVGENDEVIIPDKLWENYNLMFEERYKARVVNYPLFDKNATGFNVDGLDKTIANSKKDKIILLFNFPNNPTGYSPTLKEVDEITATIKKHADNGKKILVACDDAYYGLFYEEGLIDGSIFSRMTGLHKNVAALKIDGFSKEDYAWGLRIGFLTFSDYYKDADAYAVLEKKTTACIRTSISNCSLPAQSIFLDLMGGGDVYTAEKIEKFDILKKRANKVKEIVYNAKYKDLWDVYPFNSGYFMCIKPKGTTAEKVRVLALEKYGVGTIALGEDLRVAFSSVEYEELDDLFEIIAEVIRELR